MQSCRRTLSLVAIVSIGIAFTQLLGTGTALATSGNAAVRTLVVPVAFQAPYVALKAGSTTIDVAGCSARINEYLAPMLPYKTFTFKLPIGAENLSVKLRDPVVEQIGLKGPVALGSGPVPLSNPSLFAPEPSGRFVTSAWFPSRWSYSWVSGGRDVDDWGFKKFVTVAVCPVRYLAAEQRLRWLRSATIDISYTCCDDVKLGGEPPGEPCDLLIIAPAEFAEELGGLVAHKQLVGFRTTLVTLQDAIAGQEGRDDAERLKHFIAAHVLAHQTRYVLGVGDVDKFPVRYAEVWDNYDDYGNVTDGHFVPSDLYFADLFDSSGNFCDWDANHNDTFAESSSWSPNPDDVDFMPDVLFSRLPVGDTNQLETAVAHLIDYELNCNSSSPHFNRVVLCGAVISGPEPEGEFACEQLAKGVFDAYEKIRLYVTSTFDRDDRLNGTAVLDNIDPGCGFVTYVGHGLYGAWSFGMSNYLLARDVSTLRNETKLPFVSAASCETCGFDNENSKHPLFPGAADSIGERFLLARHGGAIAYAGATRVAYGAGSGAKWNDYYIAKMNRSLFVAYNKGYHSVGEMFKLAVEDYVGGWWYHSVYDVKTVLEFNTLGDPSVNVGGPASPLLWPIWVHLDSAKTANRGDAVIVSVSCINFEAKRECLAAIAVVSPTGEMLFFPDWKPQTSLVPITIDAGFWLNGFPLLTLNTKDLCQVGYNTVYLLLLDSVTLSPASNLGGTCVLVR